MKHERISNSNGFRTQHCHIIKPIQKIKQTVSSEERESPEIDIEKQTSINIV